MMSQAHDTLDEMLMIRASLLPEEFVWRGSADEVTAWESTLANYEQGQTPSDRKQFHVMLRVDEPLGVWLNARIDTRSDPEITVTVKRADLIPQDSLNTIVERRLNDCDVQGMKPCTKADTGINQKVFDIYIMLQDVAASYADEHCAALTEPGISEQQTSSSQVCTPIAEMKRVIFWSHHLVASSKRRQLASWCSELRVWGLIKLGYPGFMCFEGEKDDVHEMIQRVKV